MVVAYILTVCEASVEEVGAVLSDRVGPRVKEAVVTAAEKLEERGLLRGMQQGMQQGVLKGQRTLLLRQLAAKFGAVPDSVATRIDAATEEDLGRWGERLVGAATLDAVFAA